MKKKGKGKPRGMNYADVLKARRDRLQLAMDEAALLNVEQSMQRYLWLMAVSLHDAYGFGPERLQKFFEAFQVNSDELAKMRAEVDDDYAFEKLRLRAEDVSRMDIAIMGNSRLIRRKNMNAKRAAKLMQIAHYYGEEKQVCKLMEELGEATSAASEVLMLLSYHEQGGKKRDLTARLEHLAGELADVVNVTEQIIQLFGLETDFKVARHAGIQKTLKRIREEEQANETRDEPARRNL